MTPFSVFLVVIALAGGVTAQYPNYFTPQTYNNYPTYTYPNFPYSNGYSFPQYSNGGAQYGYPMQVQQPFYGGYAVPPTFGASPYMNGMDGSTVLSAQSTTAVVPNPGLAIGQAVVPQQIYQPGLPIGQAVIPPQQIYQSGLSTVPVVAGQPVPAGTSVVQSNTVEVVEEPPRPNGHFEHYAYGRDGLESKEGRTIPQRPLYAGSHPSYIRNGSPFKVTKPQHFEYLTYGRTEPMTPYTP